MYQRKLEKDIRCPLEYGMEIFGGKWNSRIICVLATLGTLRYSELRKEMGNITDAVLAAALKGLIANGIVERKSYDEIPPRVEYSLTEKGALAFLVPKGDDLEVGREKVYGFGSHSVEAHGFLEDGGIVFSPGIHHRDAFHDLAQGNAPAVVAYRYGAVLDGDVDALTLPHDKLVDGVVDDLLEQDVDTVVRRGSVAQFADVHPGTQADVFARREVDDLVFGIS